MEKQNWFDKYVLIADKYSRSLSYGVYSLAFVGIVIAARSVRPFTKFKKVTDIPASFFERNVVISGRLVSFESRSSNKPPLLLVHHHRCLNVPFQKDVINNKQLLPVEIASVNFDTLGTSWLKSVLVGKDVKLTLLDGSPVNYLICILQSQDGNDIGLQLVKLGFASVAPYEMALRNVKCYSYYYKTLLNAEHKAESKNMGMWNARKPSIFSNFFYMTLNKLVSMFRRN